MSGEMLPVIGVLLAAPAVVFFILYFLLGRRAIVAGIITALISAAAAAFLSSAGSAMATSVDPNEAMMRGAAIGFAGSAVVAFVLGFVLRLLRL